MTVISITTVKRTIYNKEIGKSSVRQIWQIKSRPNWHYIL